MIKHGRYFKRILSFYIPFICILMVLLLLLGVFVNRNQQLNYITECKNSVSMISSIIDREVNKLTKTSIILFNVINALRPCDVSSSGDLMLNYYDMHSIQGILSSSKAANPYCDRVLISFPEFSRIITDNGVFQSQEYYQLYPNYAASDSFIESGVNSLNDFAFYPISASSRRSIAQTDTILMLAYCRELSTLNTIIAYNISCNLFDDVLFQQINTEEATLVVRDESGALIYSSNPAFDASASSGEKGGWIKANGTDYYLSKSFCDVTGWDISLLTEKKYYYSGQNNGLQIYLICAILLIAFCVALSLFSSAKLYRPVEELLTTTKQTISTSKAQEFEIVNNHIRALQNEQSRLEGDIQRMVETIRNDVLKRLILYGDASVDKAELTEVMERYVINHDSTFYLVGALQAYYRSSKHIDDISGMTRLIQEWINSIVLDRIRNSAQEGCVRFIQVDVLRYMLIVDSDDESIREAIQQSFESAKHELSATHPNLYCVLSLGKTMDSFLALSEEYKSVSNSLDCYDLSSESSCIEPTDVSLSIPAPFPLDFENNLYSAILTKQTDRIAELIEYVFSRTFESSVSCRNYRLLTEQLDSINSRIAKKLGIDAVSIPVMQQNHVFFMLDIGLSRDYFIACFQQMTDYVDNPNIGRQLIEYVEQHYSDGNLCLSELADNFGFNDSYISRLFKAETGETFTNYLCNYRIQQAKQLLERDISTIDDVAVSIGIPNRRTFNRVFKKVTGLSPSMYRILNKSDDKPTRL